MAQLVEQLLLTPEILGPNPGIGRGLSTNCTLEKTKIKKKRPEMAHLKKMSLKIQSSHPVVITIPTNSLQQLLKTSSDFGLKCKLSIKFAFTSFRF